MPMSFFQLFLYVDILSRKGGPSSYIHLPTGLAGFCMLMTSLMVFMFLFFHCRQHLRAGWILCMQLLIPQRWACVLPCCRVLGSNQENHDYMASPELPSSSFQWPGFSAFFTLRQTLWNIKTNTMKQGLKGFLFIFLWVLHPSMLTALMFSVYFSFWQFPGYKWGELFSVPLPEPPFARLSACCIVLC